MLKITDKEKVLIVLGAGGTGSWLSSMLSKLDITNKILIDGDIVEPKNIKRQNFTIEDNNKYKSEVIGEKYNFDYITEYLKDASMLQEILDNFTGYVPLVVGCLDNNASRKIIHDTMELYDDFIWIDAGNAERHGQTYVAVKESGIIKYKSPIELDEAFQNYDGDERRPDQISCAEHSESAPQNIAANITSAVFLFNLINNIYNGGLLLANKYEFDTRTMSFTKSELL